MGADILKELLGCRSELFGFIRAILRNTHDAEDVFQEVARIILEKAQEGHAVADFRAWAKEIARRQVLQHYRMLRARKAASVPTEEMADLVSAVYMKHSPAPLDLADEAEALRECMAKMPERNVQIIRARYALDQGYDAIARAVRGSEVAIRRMVARLRLLLMDCVRRRLGLAERGT
jgi:RNA polymerase sigma-70 factor (ECF subfamily)